MCHTQIKQAPPTQTSAAGDASQGNASQEEAAPDDDDDDGSSSSSSEGEEFTEEEQEIEESDEGEEEQKSPGDEVHIESSCEEGDPSCCGDADSNTKTSVASLKPLKPDTERQLSAEGHAHTSKHTCPHTPETDEGGVVAASPSCSDSNGLPHSHHDRF